MSFLIWFVEAIWTLSDEGSYGRYIIGMLGFCFLAAALIVVLVKLL